MASRVKPKMHQFWKWLDDGRGSDLDSKMGMYDAILTDIHYIHPLYTSTIYIVGQRGLANVARTLIMKKARTSAHGGWIEPNTGMAHIMKKARTSAHGGWIEPGRHAHSFAACFKHGTLFKELAPFLVPLTLFMLVTTNWLMQDMVSRSTAPLRLSISVREMVDRWGDIKTWMEHPLRECWNHSLWRQSFWEPLRLMMKFFADVLYGSQTLRTTMRKKLRQQPWHPAVGIVWQDHELELYGKDHEWELLGWSGIRQKESYELLDIGPWYLRFSLDARAELFNFEDQHHVHWVASVLIPFAFQRMAIQIERRMAFQSSDFPQ